MVALRLFRVALMALALAGLAFLYVFSVASAEGAPRPRPRPFRPARPGPGPRPTRPPAPPPAARPSVPPPRRPAARVVPRARPVVLRRMPLSGVTVIREVEKLPSTPMEETTEGQPHARKVVGTGKDLTVTVQIDGKRTRVRLLGVAAPETARGNGARPRRPTGEGFLKNLLTGEFAYLVQDAGLGETDEDGTRVAYLYRAPDRLFVNQELIRQGFAVTADGHDFRHKDAFLIYEHRARADEKGLWKQFGGKQAAAPLSGAEGMYSSYATCGAAGLAYPPRTGKNGHSRAVGSPDPPREMPL